jgi:hypothetical protein
MKVVGRAYSRGEKAVMMILEQAPNGVKTQADISRKGDALT